MSSPGRLILGHRPIAQEISQPDEDNEGTLSSSGGKQLSKSRILPIGVVALAPVLFFWPLSLGGRALYWGTIALQFYPWREFYRESILSGQLPLWNPYIGSGTPFIANLQSAVFYPLNLIFLLPSFALAVNWYVIIHASIAGIGMYLLCRAYRLSGFASMAGAFAYMFSGFVISRQQFLSIGAVVAWLPLLLFFTEKIIQSTRKATTERLKYACGFTGAAAVQVLAGHMQLTYYGWWALGLYVLARLLYLWLKTQPGRQEGASTALGEKAVIMFVAFSVALMIGAVQLLPTAELALQSTRTNGAGYDFAMYYSLWPGHLLSLIIPDLFGNPAGGNYWGPGNYWENAGYIGLLPIIFAVMAVTNWIAILRRRNQAAGSAAEDEQPARFAIPFFLVLSVFSLLLALGNNLPLYPLVFEHVPGFGFFQAPARMLYLFTLAAAVLAAFGAASLPGFLIARRQDAVHNTRRVLVVGLALLVVSIPLMLIPLAKPTLVSGVARFSAFLLACTILLLFGLGKLGMERLPERLRSALGLEGKAWQVLAMVLVLGDLYLFGSVLNPSISPGVYEQATETEQWLAQNTDSYRVFTPKDVFLRRFFQYFAFDDFGDNSPGAMRDLRSTAIPQTGMLAHIREAQDYNPLEVGHYRSMLDHAENQKPNQLFISPEEQPTDLDLKLLGLANIKYILSDRALRFEGLTRVQAVDGLEVYENSLAMPRAWVARSALMAPGGALSLDLMQRATFDPRQTVLLEDTKRVPKVDSTDGPLGDVQVVDETPNMVRIQVEDSAGGFLLLADTYYPGWTAEIDQAKTEVLRADHSFRAVPLPQGDHTVIFRYEPPSFRIGVVLTALGLAAVQGMVIGLVIDHDRRKARDESHNY